MKYVVILNNKDKDNLIYPTIKKFRPGALTKEFIDTYREIDNDFLNKKFDGIFLRSIFKVYVSNDLVRNDIVKIAVINGSFDFQFNILNTKQIYIPNAKYIFINYDFISGKELPYEQASNTEEEFETSCLSFFDFDKLSIYNDIVVRKQNGEYISAKELLENSDVYCLKNIRESHNIYKMLRAGSFEFRKDKVWVRIVD